MKTKKEKEKNSTKYKLKCHTHWGQTTSSTHKYENKQNYIKQLNFTGRLFQKDFKYYKNPL